jgi:hypothetical protein
VDVILDGNIVPFVFEPKVVADCKKCTL